LREQIFRIFESTWMNYKQSPSVKY